LANPPRPGEFASASAIMVGANSGYWQLNR
jgi:hypothetical protein